MTLLKRPQHLRKRLVDLDVHPVLAVLANVLNCPGRAKRRADDMLLGALRSGLDLKAVGAAKHCLNSRSAYDNGGMELRATLAGRVPS